MEKFSRKKSVRSFGRELISECLETRDKDVIVRCSDGDITFQRFYLGIISPMLHNVLNQCHYSSMHQILILMPDWNRSEVRRLKRLHHEDIVSRSSLLNSLAILQQNHVDNSSANRNKINSTSLFEKRYSDYGDTIQDLSNLDSLDLFAPLYMEDVEIQNEDNLSLTIHSNDLDLMPPPAKKPKPKKAKPKSKNKRSKENSENVGEAVDQENKSENKCLSCQQVFPSKSLLQTHKGECKKKPNLECDKCELKFLKVVEMKKHKAEHKADVRRLVCQICTKKFKKPGHLVNHMRIHSGEKPFICHTCGKCFNQESTLRVHLRTHTGIKPFSCPECDEMFTIKTSLVSHMQWRHQKGERPFMCSFCSKSFPTKCAVRKHETIHKQEKKHACSFCDNKYARPDHLKSHMKTHKNKAVLMLDVVTEEKNLGNNKVEQTQQQQQDADMFLLSQGHV